jgi:exodeoxyribonuclease VII large subunit
MRGRHAAEQTHTLSRIARGQLTTRLRRLEQLRRQVDALNPGRRLAAFGARLATADGQLKAAATHAHHRSVTRLRGCASRLETLSPLAVLGRGYAVCWTDDRTRLVRASTDVNVGDAVTVTLAKGELRCEVRETDEVK